MSANPIELDVDIGMANETDVAAGQIATKLNLGLAPNLPAIIEEEQQNAIASMIRLPAPGVQGASQPKTSPITGEIVSGSLALPRDAADALARSKDLTTVISNELQKNLKASSSNANAMADAISERIGADQIITLQTDTENMKAQNQLRNVVRESTSLENQARLMNQLSKQAEGLQQLLKARQQEAAGGGFEFLIRSAINKEIYGTPGGRKDIEINAGLKQYQSTLAEIQGVTAATESFQTANAATRELITQGTIAANQTRIASTGQVELYKVVLEQNRSNAETLRSMLSTSNSDMSNILRGYELANSLQGRRQSAEQHQLSLQKFERQKVIDEINAKRNIIGLNRDRLQLQVDQGTVGAKIDSAFLALNQQAVTLERSLVALTIDDATQDDKVTASKVALELAHTNLDTANLAFRQAEDDEMDPLVQAARRAALTSAVESAERAQFEFDELKDTQDIRLASKEGALETQGLNIRMQEVAVEFAELTAEGKTAEAFALMKDALTARDDLATVKTDNVASVQAYQSFIYGAHNVEDPAVINSHIDEPKYVLMRRLGATPNIDGGFLLGITAAKANANLLIFEADGIVSNEISGVKILREVRSIIQKKRIDNPLSVPADAAAAAIEFNAEAEKYNRENNSEIRFDDFTNPLQPPTIPQLVELSPTVAAQTLFADLLTPSGSVDLNMDTIIAKGLAAVQSEIFSQDELVEGVVAMGKAIAINNNVNHHGMVSIGLPPQHQVNMRVMKPRGAVSSLFNNFGTSLSLGVSLVSQGSLLQTPVNSTIAKIALTAASQDSSDFITLDITDAIAVRQYMITVLSSSTIGGRNTERSLDVSEEVEGDDE